MSLLQTLKSEKWKVSKYRAFSGLYFPAFGVNTERYGVNGPEKTPYLGTFHAVKQLITELHPFWVVHYKIYEWIKQTLGLALGK